MSQPVSMTYVTADSRRNTALRPQVPGAKLDLTTTPAEPDDAQWHAIAMRSGGGFVYGVRSTGIFCRPSCPSRRPLRRNTVVFGTPVAAVAAGFRACLRCEPLAAAAPPAPHAGVVGRATAWLKSAESEAPTSDDLARAAGVSATALRRSFQHVLGVTPAEFLRARRLDRFRTELRVEGVAAPVTMALHAAGFGSTSRLYERSPATLGMTPTALRRGAPQERITYALADCLLGRVLVATTARGICAIQFADSDEELVGELRERFPRAMLQPVDSAQRTPALDGPSPGQEASPESKWLSEAVRFVLAHMSEHPLAAAFPTDVRATAFQRRVWQALQAIPRGETLSYAGLAEQLGRPTAARAVAAACARNPLALANPCHRVVGSSGALTGYRWGLERKRRLLANEQG